MRRVIMALLATTMGTLLLVGLKSRDLGIPFGPAAAAVPGEPADAGRAPGAESPPTTPVPNRTPGKTPGTTPGASTTTKAATKPATKPASTTKPPTQTRTTTAPPASRTIVGPAVAAVWHGEDYGDMQVKIVVTGTHIDDIITIQQSNRPGRVSTTLRAQALQAQSANVGNVSGATASSDAYKQSLAGAIAKI